MDNIDFQRLIGCIEIHEINPDTNFWMVRTNQGRFYDEFIRENFIALGWNIITEERISNNKTENEKKLIYEEIKKNYKGTKQPGRVYNKCVHFVEDIRENDIIMIPKANSEAISFALAGEYYEAKSLDYTKEIEVNAQINEGWGQTFSIKCPYRKRRKIKLLKTISGSRINPNLYKALVSYHGISNIYDYRDYILSSIYNVYYWDNQINYVFNIEKQKDINPVHISNLIINFADIVREILVNETDINELSGKMNINSPGDLMLTIQNCASSVFEFIASNKLVFIAVWLSLFGGNVKLPFGFEFSTGSLLEFIHKFREQSNKFKNDELNRELLQMKMKALSNNAEKLHINKSNYNNIVDLEKYFRKDD